MSLVPAYAQKCLLASGNIYSDIPEFKELDSIVSYIYAYSYETNDESFEVNDLLTTCVLERVRSFQESSAFDTELLTGLQFGDPSDQEIKIV